MPIDETTKDEAVGTDETPAGKTVIPVMERIDLLLRIAEILADTIRGCVDPIACQTLANELAAVTRRITWVEKCGDPDYKPLDKDSSRRTIFAKKEKTTNGKP
jgi:hypothetical protein